MFIHVDIFMYIYTLVEIWREFFLSVKIGLWEVGTLQGGEVA